MAKALNKDCTGEVTNADVFAKIEGCKGACDDADTNASSSAFGFSFAIFGLIVMMLLK